MQQSIFDAMTQFPALFGLRAFPGEVFAISLQKSYVSDYPRPGTIYLYTCRKVGEHWLDFAKATPAELYSEVVILSQEDK